MDCRQVQPRMADFSVGLLRAGEQEQVERHLAACAACGREWRELQAVLGLVERFGAREPPPHLWNGVYNRIIAPDAAPSAPSFWERLRGVPGRLIAGAATGLAAAALIGGLFFSPLSGNIGSKTTDLGPLTGPSAAAVQEHAMLAGFEPLADEVGLEAYSRLVNNPNVNTQLAR